MKKMFAIMKREYFQAVRKKVFIIMTILFPFLMAALLFLPGLMLSKGMGQKRIAVLDGTGKLQEAFSRPNAPEKVENVEVKDVKKEAQKALEGGGRQRGLPAQFTIEYRNDTGKDVEKEVQPYLKRLSRDDDAADKLEGVFVIPGKALADQKTQLTYYSRSATDFMTQERLGRLANRTLQSLRLSANGVKPELLEELLQDLPVEAVQLSRTGEKKTGGELNFLFAFILGALLILPSFVYGQETMRGIVQEKTERVVEVLISSVTPMELLTGKILGIAAVGLTQICVWLTMIGLAGAYGAALAAAADINLAQFVRPSVFAYFFLFFKPK